MEQARELVAETPNLFGSHLLQMEYFTVLLGRLLWATRGVLPFIHLNTQPWFTGHYPDSPSQSLAEDV